MNTLEAIQTRRSVRGYRADTHVPQGQMLQIVDAGRLAPTARNEQPWEFIVVDDRDTLRDLAALAENGRFLAKASACIAVIAAPVKYYLEDGSAATTQMLLAATELGWATCWIAGDKKDYAADVLRLLGAPDSMKLVALIAIGKGADQTEAPKRALADVTHWNGFGRRVDIGG